MNLLFDGMTRTVNRYDSLINCQRDIGDVFSFYQDHLDKVRDIATGISAELEKLGTLMQQHTDIVCPECTNICCINRHSYHALDDIIYIYGIGGGIPIHKSGLDDDAPCQFLGNSGCTVPRVFRPYRCNWYFCSSLLEHIIEHSSSRHYRSFIKLLQWITVERQEMTKEYASVLNKIAF